MKNVLTILLAMTLCFSCAACAGNSPTVLPKDTTVLTDGIKAMDIDTDNGGDIDTDNVNNIGIRTFGLDLLSLAEDDNPVISPLSAYLCLAMVANGADGATMDEFTALLGGDVDSLNSFSLAITQVLTEAEENGTIFRVSNSAWVDDEANIYEDYLTSLVTYFSSEMYSGELDSDSVMKAINSWVNEKTEGMIPSLLSDNLPEDAMLALINTIYMKATWQNTFTQEATYQEVFHTADGDVTADFMHETAYMSYIESDGVSGVILPYSDGTLEFVALKPTGGKTVRELLAELDSETFTELVNGAENTYIYLSIPKFTTEYTMDMNDPLRELGLVSAFDSDTADFGLMGTGPDGSPLYLSSVLQKVKIIVDEKGTEAAAATLAVMAAESAIENEPVKLSFDEPFLYAIVDTTYNAPVFLGIMDNPAA